MLVISVFQTPKKLDSTILKRFTEVDDVIGFPSLGKNSPIATVILIEKEKHWNLNSAYLDRYVDVETFKKIDTRFHEIVDTFFTNP